MEKGDITSCSISLFHAELAYPKGKANQPFHGMAESGKFIGEEEKSKGNHFLGKERLISQLIVPDRATATVSSAPTRSSLTSGEVGRH